MKVQGTLIMRTFRGMAASSLWIPALSNSLRQDQPMAFHPNTFKFSSATAITNSARRWPVEVRSRNTTPVVKRNSEHSHGERSRENGNYPRPQEVPWQKMLANRVHFIGTIGQPVQFKHTRSGKASASTRLGVKIGSQGEIMWFTLVFWNELAETAAQHLKINDKVYVSGFLGLQSTAGEDDKLQIYQVIATTLNFIEKTSPAFPHQAVVSSYKSSHVKSPDFSQQAVVSGYKTSHLKPPDFSQQADASGYKTSHVKTPDFSQQAVVSSYKTSHVKSPDFSQQAVVSGYKTSHVKSSSSSRDADFIESLWQEFFSSPLEWWDNRTNKKNLKAPDFKHKDTGEVLWIWNKSTPPWVKSQLAVLDSRMKVLEEWGKDRSSARSQGSFSSSQHSSF